MNLDGRTFRSVSNTGNGEVGSETLFRYRQQGAVVSADYSGGRIACGHLLGKVLADGRLEFAYHHLNTAGEVMAGRCLSTPRLLPDGRIRLLEEWQWLTGDRTQGRSEVEEVLLPGDRGGDR